MSRALFAFLSLFTCACPLPALTYARPPDTVTVFAAKKVITMNPSQPEATAVAVSVRRILGVGSLEDLKPWLENREHTIDRTFAEKVLMPGFIDPGTAWLFFLPR